MEALVVRPGEAHSARVEGVRSAVREGEVAVRTLEVGVCGTDREISEGFGVAPEGDDLLVLGHEFLGVVEQDGTASRAATWSRRSCAARARTASPAARAPGLLPHGRLQTRARNHAPARIRAGGSWRRIRRS